MDFFVPDRNAYFTLGPINPTNGEGEFRSNGDFRGCS